MDGQVKGIERSHLLLQGWLFVWTATGTTENDIGGKEYRPVGGSIVHHPDLKTKARNSFVNRGQAFYQQVCGFGITLACPCPTIEYLIPFFSVQGLQVRIIDDRETPPVCFPHRYNLGAVLDGCGYWEYGELVIRCHPPLR